MSFVVGLVCQSFVVFLTSVAAYFDLFYPVYVFSCFAIEPNNKFASKVLISEKEHW